jgi:drug/metabolite transporter (DMT)-like permease
MVDKPDAQVPRSASEAEDESSLVNESMLQPDVEDADDNEPELGTPFQRLLWWTGFIAVDLEVLLVLASALKLVRWRGSLESWILFGLAGVIGICWVLLQWTYGKLGDELKKFVTGNGKNFRSDSSLSPLAQVLVVAGALLVGGLGFYFCVWYVKH